MSNFNLKLKKN